MNRTNLQYIVKFCIVVSLTVFSMTAKGYVTSTTMAYVANVEYPNGDTSTSSDPIITPIVSSDTVGSMYSIDDIALYGYAQAHAFTNAISRAMMGDATSRNNGAFCYKPCPVGGSYIYMPTTSSASNTWSEAFVFSGSGTLDMHFSYQVEGGPDGMYDGQSLPPEIGRASVPSQLIFTLSGSLGTSMENLIIASNPDILAATYHISNPGIKNIQFDLITSFDKSNEVQLFSMSTFGQSYFSSFQYILNLTSVTFSPDTTIDSSMKNASGTLAFYASPVPVPRALSMMFLGLGVLGVFSCRKTIQT